MIIHEKRFASRALHCARPVGNAWKEGDLDEGGENPAIE